MSEFYRAAGAPLHAKAIDRSLEIENLNISIITILPELLDAENVLFLLGVYLLFDTI